jgi:hypothetical protein
VSRQDKNRFGLLTARQQCLTAGGVQLVGVALRVFAS